MHPRHPLLFNVATVCVLIGLVGVIAPAHRCVTSLTAKMHPRHPLLFKVATVCVLIGLVGVMFYNSKPVIIITRNFVVVTRAPKLTHTEEMSTKITLNAGLKPSNVTIANKKIPNTTTPLPPPTTEEVKLNTIGENLEFLIDQEECDNDTYLMIYIHSGPENTERRRVVRTTWATPEILKKHKARLVFVMGEPQDENTQAAIENENELYSDIIQGNFVDAYRNLTYKAITGLKWVSNNCGNAVYVLKTDDDMVVDIHRVVRVMRAYLAEKWGTRGILGGHIWPHMDVDRNTSSKWYTSPEEFPDPFFKTYCSGSSYIMSSDVVKKFYVTSEEVPFFWVDDYYVTGMLAHASKVTHRSLNDRYVLENTADIKGLLKKDKSTRLVFIHSPNTNTSVYAWKHFEERWGFEDELR